jgi:hypothetical protein
MNRTRSAALLLVLLTAAWQPVAAVDVPTGLVSRAGDRSIVLHWERPPAPGAAGYRVYRSTTGPDGAFSPAHAGLLALPGYCDLSASVINGQTNLYRVTAVATGGQESEPSATLAVVPRAFADDDAFLDYIQQCHFDYFWYLANPANGLVPDRSTPTSPCSIAAVGFGLTAIGIGIDHGWISRAAGAARVRTTLETFLQGPQGPGASGTIGHNGWFYHFLDMNTAVRAPGSELSSIDTALLLGGILYAKQYFDGADAEETAIRDVADAIVARVDWTWMARGTDAVALGWFPDSGFIPHDWIGYNEAMILYVLGLGAAANPLPASAWNRWTSGYAWATHYEQEFVRFPPLFGHQFSHCWIDFRHIADAYMNSRGSTYFENSRRATIAQRAYCIDNPLNRVGYSGNVWGITPSDGPNGYAARGAPPAENDDGTIAPTAPGGSIAFTPEYSLPTLRHFYTQFRPRIWTAHGFRDAFNLGAQWYASDTLGLDQGPIVVMIENYRTQRVWQLFMRNEEVQRGLERAGFVPLAWIAPALQPLHEEQAFRLSWDAQADRDYQVEYSPDLAAWFASPIDPSLADTPPATWTDAGPPASTSPPWNTPQRFYRVFQFGDPAGTNDDR